MEKFDWQGNAGLGGSPGPDYRDPNNPNFNSVGGVLRWWIPLMGLPVALVVGAGLIAFFSILSK